MLWTFRFFKEFCTFPNWELWIGAETSEYIWLSKNTLHFYLIVLNLCHLKKCTCDFFVNICCSSLEKKCYIFLIFVAAALYMTFFIINSLCVILETDSQIDKRKKKPRSCNCNLPSDALSCLPSVLSRHLGVLGSGLVCCYMTILWGRFEGK